MMRTSAWKVARLRAPPAQGQVSLSTRRTSLSAAEKKAAATHIEWQRKPEGLSSRLATSCMGCGTRSSCFVQTCTIPPAASLGVGCGDRSLAMQANRLAGDCCMHACRLGTACPSDSAACGAAPVPVAALVHMHGTPRLAHAYGSVLRLVWMRARARSILSRAIGCAHVGSVNPAKASAAGIPANTACMKATNASAKGVADRRRGAGASHSWLACTAIAVPARLACGRDGPCPLHD